MELDDSPSVSGMSAADNSSATNGHHASQSLGKTVTPAAATLRNLRSRVQEAERTIQALAQALQRTSVSDGRSGTRADEHNDGTPRQEQVAIHALHDLAGAAARYLAASDGAEQRQQVTDVALRVAAEAALRESEERYRLLAENATDVIVRLARDGSILYVSPSVRQVLGFDPRTLLGQLAVEFIHPGDQETVSQAVARSIAQPGVQIVVYRNLQADGTYVWVESALRVTRGETGAIGELQASIRDISARKHAEDALQRSEARYRRIIETAQEGIWQLDGEGRITFANDRLAELLGYSLPEMLGRSPGDFVPDGDRQLAFARWERRSQGLPETAEVRYRCKDGRTLWARVQSFPLLDEYGAAAGAVVMVADVTARREAEQAQARLAAIVESFPDSIVRASTDWVIESWNAGATRLFGYTEAEAIGRPISLLLPPGRLAESVDIAAELAQGRHLQHRETVRRHKDGHDIDVVLNVAPIRDASGALIGSASVTQDIGDRKRSEAALRESEARFRLLAENATDVISLFSPDLRLLYVSPSVRQILGADPDKVLGLPAIQFVHPDDRDTIAQVLARIMAEPVSATATWRTVCGDGTYRWVEVTGRAVRDAQTGEVLEVQTATRDISARKRAEDALRESERRYRLLAENAADVINLVSPDLRLLYVSPSAQQVLGNDPDEAVGRSALDYVHPDDRGAIAQALARIVALPGRESAIWRTVCGDGTYRWVESTGRAVRDAQTGEVLEIQTATRDISARRQAEDALRHSEERYRRIVETSLVGIFQCDASDRYVFVNRRAAEIIGYTSEELLGISASVLQDADYQETYAARLAARQAGGLHAVQTECKVRCKDGTLRWVQLSLVPLADAQGQYCGVFGMAVDIHQRKLAERALQERAQERLEQARVAEALAEVGALLARSLAFESIPAGILKVMARVVPCTIAHVFVYRDGCVEPAGAYGKPDVSLGTVVTRLDGGEDIFPRVAGQVIMLGETRNAPGWQSIIPWVGAHEVRSVILLPLLVHGEIYGCLAVGSTMPEQFTERHLEIARAFAERIAQALWNARLYQLEQARARAAEHLAALRNEFVTTASHELRTPLAVVLGFAEVLEGRWSDLSDEQRRRHVRRIVQAANRQKRLVDDLLRVSTLEVEHMALQRQDVPLVEIVTQAIAVMNANYPGQAIDAAGPLSLLASVDRTYAEQVLINLLDNAAKYGGEGSGIVVEWTAEDSMAVVRVRDHGPGIPQEGRGLLFTRFGRLPGSGMRAGHVGTGLGLYLGRVYAEAMGGTLELESSGPHGSVFCLRLPLRAA